MATLAWLRRRSGRLLSCCRTAARATEPSRRSRRSRRLSGRFLARRSWAGLPEQEKQIQAMVRELRTVRQMDRPGAGLLRRRRQGQARKRYVGLAVFSAPQLVDEAELRGHPAIRGRCCNRPLPPPAARPHRPDTAA